LDQYGEVAAKEIATKTVAGKSLGLNMPVWVKFHNPFDMRYSAKDYPINRIEIEYDLDEEGDVIDGSERGDGVKLVNALREAADYYQVDVTDAVVDIFNGTNPFELYDILKNNNYTDLDGEYVSPGQFLQEVLKDAGYDGIIMSAHDFFNRMGGVNGQTFHLKPFYGNQIKSQFNEGDYGLDTDQILKSLSSDIDVDGVKRPTMNSEGRPIHLSEEEIRNFWRWFGDSIVVDDQGRPLVVYHGTDAKDFYDFEPGSYFSSSPKEAGAYGQVYKLVRREKALQKYTLTTGPKSLDGTRVPYAGILSDVVDMLQSAGTKIKNGDVVATDDGVFRKNGKFWDAFTNIVVDYDAADTSDTIKLKLGDGVDAKKFVKNYKKGIVAAWNDSPGGERGRVLPVYLKISNPVELDPFIANRLGKRLGATDESISAEINKYAKKGFDAIVTESDEALFSPEVREDLGGVPVHYIVFKPEQVKSATGNVGAFNESSGNIDESRSPEIQFTIDELIAAAKSQKSWKDWYTRYEPVLNSLFGSDAPLFKKLLSATSQATSVPSNVGLAVKAYRQFLAGEPFTGYMEAVAKNLDRVRNEENLRGQKIAEFAKANAGDGEGIAVDRHIARLFFNTDRPTAKQVEVAKERIIQIAKRLKWKPSEVQAALWAFNQVRTGKDPSKVVSYDTLLLKKLQQINAIRAQYGRGEGAGVPTSGTVAEGNYGRETDTDGTGEDGEVSVRESRAPGVVVNPRAPSPTVIGNGTAQGRQQLADYAYGRMDTVMRNTPQWGKATIGKALGELSNMPTSARKFVYYAAQLPQLADMIDKTSPSAAARIRGLGEVLAARKTRADKRKAFIEKILLDGKAAVEKYTPAQLAKFEEVTHNLSREQIDPWDTANKTHPLSRQFYALPKPLQDIFSSVVAAYRQFGDEYLDHMEKIAGPAFSPAMKMQYKMRMKRIMPYLPLFREGDFWVAYTDRTGEAVVRACDTDLERSQVMRAAQAAGATDIQPFKQLADINPNNVKPTREFAQIFNLMKEKGVDEAVQAKVYQTLLQMFPAKSIMQQFRPRKGTLGYREDILRNFAIVGSRMADNLTQFEFTKDIDNVYSDLGKELLKSERSGDDVAVDMLNELKQRENFLRYPVNSKYANLAASASYNQFLLGNISSSVMNSTSLVMSTLPVLGGEYGYGRTAAAMSRALSMYAKGGRDDNTSLTIFGRRLSDKTFMGDSARGKALEKSRPDLKKLYDTAISRQAIHRSVGLELHDMRKMALSEYTGSWMKIKTLLSWLFQNSERMNREITLLAAYQLEMDELAKRGIRGDAATNQAIDKAIKAITFTQGVATPELGSRALQGNIGKVIGTFKKYPMTQLYMVGTLFNDAIRGASAKEKQIAQKQLLGIMGMGWAFAGVKGLPLVGGISFLAEMIIGDDDEPFDIDQWALESMGNLGWNGLVSDMTGLRISDRAAIGSFFREDKKRLQELGWQWYLAEQTIGAPASLVKNWIDASELFQQGYTLKAAERALPLFMGNAIKAVDQGINGIVTKDGVRIADDPNTKDLIMQGIGFRKESTARAQDVNTIENQITTAVNARRTQVLNNLWRFRNDPERLAEAREARDDFNRSRYGQLPKNRITAETIEKSKKQHKVVDRAAAAHAGMAPDQRYKAAFRELEESVDR
jgi:hypothetical protein